MDATRFSSFNQGKAILSSALLQCTDHALQDSLSHLFGICDSAQYQSSSHLALGNKLFLSLATLFRIFLGRPIAVAMRSRASPFPTRCSRQCLTLLRSCATPPPTRSISRNLAGLTSHFHHSAADQRASRFRKSEHCDRFSSSLSAICPLLCSRQSLQCHTSHCKVAHAYFALRLFSSWS